MWEKNHNGLIIISYGNCWWISDNLSIVASINQSNQSIYQSLLAANNTELLERLEELMLTWAKQIEQVLAQSEQIRREADDIGPAAELAYWKSRMSKFNK